MTNKELADKLIAQFAGYHAPVRFMVQEAAKRILRMDETLEKVKQERNAAVRDLGLLADCDVCKHKGTCVDCYGDSFEWRGVNHG